MKNNAIDFILATGSWILIALGFAYIGYKTSVKIGRKERGE